MKLISSAVDYELDKILGASRRLKITTQLATLTLNEIHCHSVREFG